MILVYQSLYGMVLLLSFWLDGMLLPTFGFQSNLQALCFTVTSKTHHLRSLFIVTVKLPLAAEPDQNLIIVLLRLTQPHYIGGQYLIHPLLQCNSTLPHRWLLATMVSC
ncbi:hypothetical protein L873DRAFT_1125214 [Choiromyces venosus 120613-1]|uniref:Uncharacterized protein n=1 Tax=Choiromyces venosus 120613-1 TaxID=1336337 RepID=A0A3N4JJY7_9PEZI|nr:hypothetical protein L873DRAFT_1125214 [Choiromyces venosus 120613-1]